MHGVTELRICMDRTGGMQDVVCIVTEARGELRAKGGESEETS